MTSEHGVAATMRRRRAMEAFVQSMWVLLAGTSYGWYERHGRAVMLLPWAAPARWVEGHSIDPKLQPLMVANAQRVLGTHAGLSEHLARYDPHREIIVVFLGDEDYRLFASRGAVAMDTPDGWGLEPSQSLIWRGTYEPTPATCAARLAELTHLRGN